MFRLPNLFQKPDTKYNFTDLVEDRSIWRFASELRAAVEYVWLHLDDVLSQSSDPEEQLEESLDQEGDDLEQQPLQQFPMAPPQPVS